MAPRDQDNASRKHRPDAGVIPYRPPAPPSTTVYEPEDVGYSGAAESSSIRDLLLALFRRRWLIVAVLVLGVAVSAAMTLTKTPLYRSSVTLEVQREETRIIEGSSVEPLQIADAEHMATQNALLVSRSLAERVAETLDLTADPRFANEADSRPARLKAATDAVLGGLQVAPVPRSRVTEVRYVSPYPEEAARIANAVADSFIEMNLERKYNATSYAREFLEERLQTTKTALEDAERRLVSYSTDKEILDLSSAGGSEIGSSLDASSLITLNTSLTDAQEERIASYQRYLEAKDDPAGVKIPESGTLKDLESRRAELDTQYQEKLTTFKPDFPDMKELASRITAIDVEIDRARTKVVNRLESEYNAALAREASLTSRVGELKNRVQDLRTRSIDYNILDREVDTLRSQYEALLQRYKEISISGGIGSSQVSIVDRAVAPVMPFEPNIRSAILRGLLLSLVVGIGLALLLEYVDDTIKTPEDIRTKLGLPVIGIVPKFKGHQSISKHLRDPGSEVSEAYASARTALQFATNPTTVLVTGVRPAEGKTSSALALALAFAGIGNRALIIDADMRRPSFGVDAGRSIGLAGLLAGDAPLVDHVVAGDVDGVFLLPSGSVPLNPAELLSGPRLARVLEEASASFDVVIVDSPPVLAFADAPALCAMCKDTLIVLQAQGVRCATVKRAIERLQDSRGSIVGVLLTKIDPGRSGYEYGYQYHSKYRSGQKRSKRAGGTSRRRIKMFEGSEGSRQRRGP